MRAALGKSTAGAPRFLTKHIPSWATIAAFHSSCPHCVDFEPTYKQLAEKSRQSPDLVVARVDGTQNPDVVSMFGVRTYPTVRYYPRGYSTTTHFPGEPYNGDRTLPSLTSWLKDLEGETTQSLMHKIARFKQVNNANALPVCKA